MNDQEISRHLKAKLRAARVPHEAQAWAEALSAFSIARGIERNLQLQGHVKSCVAVQREAAEMPPMEVMERYNQKRKAKS